MPDLDFPPGLLDYFAAREERRQQDIAAALPSLERRMAEFVAAHAGEPGLPVVLARMIREVAIQAWVRSAPPSAQIPKGSVILFETLYACRSFDDLCPAWRIFDGRQEEEDDDG